MVNSQTVKLVRLNKKAQKCKSRKKAQKLLKKWDKSQKGIRDRGGRQIDP